MSYRKCPECKSSTYEEVHNGVTVDKCRSCEGIFLDFGEIKEIIENINSVNTFDTIQKGDFTKDNVGQRISCSNCDTEMIEKEYIYGSGNHINFCNNCGGVYLDKGEIKDIQDYEISRFKSKEGIELYNRIEKKGLNISKNQNKILEELDTLNNDSKKGFLHGLINKILN